MICLTSIGTSRSGGPFLFSFLISIVYNLAAKLNNLSACTFYHPKKIFRNIKSVKIVVSKDEIDITNKLVSAFIPIKFHACSMGTTTNTLIIYVKRIAFLMESFDFCILDISRNIKSERKKSISIPI